MNIQIPISFLDDKITKFLSSCTTKYPATAEKSFAAGYKNVLFNYNRDFRSTPTSIQYQVSSIVFTNPRFNRKAISRK
ncbi:MAG: hypothetical protein K8R79_03890 [Calditrichales bacterium]|nr:hypothetical protein [Calditrichales bacterium]